ncbi:MAG: class I SAM-dependent methyltransferase [Anaerolineales bacterium]|jgi:SAM-dependent methyltransferase
MLDFHQGKAVIEIIERDDGLVTASPNNPLGYFANFPDWPIQQQEAMGYVRGRTLDVGCGAGRVCLYLQEQGHPVTGIDNSPLALEVSRQRGVRNLSLTSITQVSKRRLGEFDTVLMLGNNFGLFGSPQRARRILRRFDHMTSSQGRIIAESTRVYETDDPIHLSYHEFNRQRGRMPGQLRLRILHRKMKGPWFDYLLVSQDEMQAILQGTGWQVTQFIDSPNGPQYVAIIDKTHVE